MPFFSFRLKKESRAAAIERKLVANYFANLLTVSVIFSVSVRYLHLKCKGLMLFLSLMVVNEESLGI